MESVIDALSHQQLRSLKGDKAFNAVYFSTGGQLTPQQVDTISRYVASLEKSPSWTISLAFDNDVKGHLFDLQFIQHLVATKLPLTPTTVGINRVGYLLPEQDVYRPIREALLDRIEIYNKGIRSLNEKLSDQLITVDCTDQRQVLNIPETSNSLAAVSINLLKLTGLGQRINIGKSAAKDFNQELKQTPPYDLKSL